VGPNAAFLLLIFGLLAIYCEFLRPGLIFPGVLGAAAASAGACFLFRGPLQIYALVLLGVGALLLAGEAFCGPYLLLGALGATSLTLGFALLFPGPRRIAPALAIPASALFGTLTACLASLAKRARRSKWSDLAEPP
jgi:membrane-bound serine protease (ClpP class)